MEIFQKVKASVTARQAAEMYGLKVGRNGRACCPFHQDKTPSMKVDDRYYCFGCGVTGDAIDLTMQLGDFRQRMLPSAWLPTSELMSEKPSRRQRIRTGQEQIPTKK